ncbi:hypothetical protein [Micromonospora endolithica]|uniref:hypothetical protein n=1 Tax=Micromonospora endolithica TaxID=230091 RepID=UPI0011ABAF55|nr:hypothetical protein [Micromonospora endolithica]TWJ21372.1 hypothetical protein JD76_01482 [Micromonospora endolithica]
MTVDEELSRALDDLTRGLTPQPDPYGRVVARHRRARQRRAVGLTTAVVVSLTGAVVAVGGPGTPAQPPPADSTDPVPPVLAWSEKLLQSPPRGAVARDAAYVRGLTDLLSAAQRSGDIARLRGVPVREVRVLFVDDVGGRRIALAAFVREEPDPNTGWPSAAVWLVAPEGADAEELADSNAIRSVSDALEPVESMVLEDTAPRSGEPAVQVAIAPAECVFLSSPMPVDPARWTPEPTSSYLVRTPQTRRPEWWRVDCGPVTRRVVPAPGSLVTGPITDAQLATAMSRSRGTADAERSRALVQQTAQTQGYRASALPTVVWGAAWPSFRSATPRRSRRPPTRRSPYWPPPPSGEVGGAR